MNESESTLVVFAHSADFRDHIGRRLGVRRIERADDVEAAARLLRSSEPVCLVVIDAPPARDALDALRRLGAARTAARCPVVVVSDRAHDRSWRRDALRAGATEVVARSADAVGLGRAIEDAIDRGAALRSAARDDRGLEALVERLPIGVGLTDLQGRTRFLNAEALRLHGFASLDEMLVGLDQYRDDFELRSLDGRALPVEEWPISRALRDEPVTGCEVTLRRRSAQTEHVVAYTAVRVHDSLGEPTLLFVIEDVAARKDAEARFRASDQRYRMLFEAIDEGFCVFEMIFDEHDVPIDYRFLEINPTFERQTGLVDAVGKTARTLVPDLDESWFRIYGGVARTGEPVRFENHAPAMGRWFDVYASRVGAPDEHKVGLLFRDVTERKRVEDALRESEARFRGLADNISQLAWMADEKGWISWYNQRWFAFTGTTLDEMQGWGWQKVHHPEHVERVVEKFRRCVEDGVVWEDTFPLRGKSGEYRWFLSRAQPIRDESGRIVRWFGTNTDVTDQRETEELLRQAVRQRDEFLSVASHELRTPLTALGLQLQSARRLLDKDPVDVANVTKRVDMAIRQNDRIGALVERLLDVSRIVSGRLRLEPEPVDLDELTREIAERLGDMAARAGCELRVTSRGSVVGSWDRARIEQVLVNLLTNAIKYGPGRPIDASVERLGAHVELRVHDRGIGVSVEDQQRIFGRFEQAVSPVHYGGLGLGLYITRDIVQAHGGTIDVQSAPGEGSTFVVRLPVTGPGE